MAPKAHTMSFLTTSADILDKPATLPESAISFVGLVDTDGTRYELNPEFGGALVAVMRALTDGKIVHIDADEEFVSAERAAELLGVTRPTVYAWQDRGLLKREDHGPKRMVPMVDIDRYQREQGERAAWRERVRSIANQDGLEEAADQAAVKFDGALDLTKDTTTAPQRPRRRNRG